MNNATGAIVPGAAVAREVIQERVRQEAKWGEQNHPDGTTGVYGLIVTLSRALQNCEAHRTGWAPGATSSLRKFYEAAEVDPAKLREELIQVAAVAVAWMEAIDRRTA
jgi:hypothetical protein